MSTGALSADALLILLTIFATVLIPSMIVGWVRERREQVEQAELRRRYFAPCPVCHHTAGVHDLRPHEARGIPVDGPTINRGRNFHRDR